MENIRNVNDKTDLMFVHCAIKYGADFLVSNDFRSGMFNLDSSYDFNVVSTSDFLSLVKEGNN
jgi:predicted nucleic acid-binding protein